jgi:hypothetical protein
LAATAIKPTNNPAATTTFFIEANMAFSLVRNFVWQPTAGHFTRGNAGVLADLPEFGEIFQRSRNGRNWGQSIAG